MKQLLLILTLSCLTIFAATAQQEPCNFGHLIDQRLANDPSYANDMQQLDQQIQDYMQQNPNAGAARGGVNTISVAVHVVYNTSAENVSTTSINNLINTLNRDYRNLLATSSNTRSQFLAVAGDAQMEFCLDTIVRRSTSVTCFDPNSSPNAMKSNSTGGSTPLDTRYYLNIWIVDLCGNTGGGVAGYAYLPTTGMPGSSIDGLVIDYSLGYNNGNGGTATHEIGHYFGLQHPWGSDSNPSCSTDDGFSDTPNTDGPNYSCTYSETSCGSTDMIENHMDYSACPTMFTAEQVAYMNSVLTQVRSTLLNSPGCNSAGGAPSADFTADRTTVCAGEAVAFTDNSTGSPSSWSWSFTGGSPSTSTTQNPSVTYNTPGTYTVSLTVTNATGTDTETKTAYITVRSAASLPLVEGFQGSFVPADWELSNPDASFTWERTTAAGGYGASSASMYINNYDYNAAGSQDLILTPVYDFTNVPNARMTFDIAYAEYDANSPDSLLIIVTPDCGANFYLLEEFGGAGMSTVGSYVTGAFTPTSSQWRTDTVDLSALSGYGNVQIGFFSITGYGNNLYLDNINIATPVVSAAPVADFVGAPTTVSVGGTVNFTDQSTNSPTSWSWTFTGGTPSSSTAQNPTGIQYNTVGTYPVTLTATNSFGNDTETKTAYINVVQGGGGTGACSTLTNVGANDTLTLYLAGTNGTGGYLSGHNQYGDKAKADAYTGILANSTVDSVFVYFGVAKDGGNNGTVNITVWDADGTAGAPGTILGTQAVPITSLSTTGLSGVVFNPPITVNGDFYAGVQLTYGPGDTVAIVTNRVGAMATGTGTAWEQWDDNSWHSYTDAYTADLAHVIFVNVCEPSTSPNLPTADFSAATTSGCPGTSVSFTNASTNATSYSWTFTGGTPATSTATSPTVTYNTAGTYAVTLVASNANGSDTETKTSYITINAAPSLSFADTPVSCNGGNDGAVDLTVTGGAPFYTYQWSNGSNDEDLISVSAGTYTVTVTDDNGCTATGNTQLSQPTAISVSASTTAATCGNANGSATASAIGGSGPYTYAWSSGATGATINNLLPGTYTVTATDDNGCTALGSAIISGGQAVTVVAVKTDATCAGNDGTASASAIGGSGNYTYNWSNGQSGANITGLAAGTYTVTANDGAGCTGTSSVTISAPVAITYTTSSSNASCGSSDGSATINVSGGTSPYSYTWSTGGTTATVNNIAAGSYTVTVSDQGGCTITTSVSVSNAGGPTVSVASQTNVFCNGASTGSISLSVSGGSTPYQYSWTNAVSTISSANGLPAGSYSITVTDAASCVSIANVTLTEPTALTLNTSSVTNVSCFGGNTGAASVAASGGVAPYTYTWSGGGSGATRSNLTAGNYTVTVTDNNNCTTTTSVSITEPTQLSINVTRTSPGCATPNGTATANVSGGVGPYSYLWSNGSSANPATGLTAGSYTVTATDDNGCTVLGSVTLSSASGPSASSSSTPVSCGATNNGSASVTATGGATPYTYTWTDANGDPVSSNATANGLASGTYNYTVTDANGCVATGSQVVSSLGPDLDETIVDVSGCFGNNNGAINLTVTGGTSPYNYAWSNGQSTRNIAALEAGSYTITAVDNSGCSVVATYTVGGPTQVVPGASVTDATSTITTDGSATVSPTGGTAPYTVTWSNGATGNTAFNLGTGTYTVAVTDANGCTRTESFVIGVSTGINDLAEVIQLNIYPNPTSGIVNIEVELNTSSDLHVDVYNMVGERVIEMKKFDQVSTSVQLDMTDLPEAAYFIRVSAAGQVVNTKLLKLNQ